MKLYKAKLGWTDGIAALIFHGQRADRAEIFNLTSIFQVAEHYDQTQFAETKLMLGYIIGGFTKHLANYSEGHYLLTSKGGTKQQSLLKRRGLTPEDVWILDPSDPRRTKS